MWKCMKDTHDEFLHPTHAFLFEKVQVTSTRDDGWDANFFDRWKIFQGQTRCIHQTFHRTRFRHVRRARTRKTAHLMERRNRIRWIQMCKSNKEQSIKGIVSRFSTSTDLNCSMMLWEMNGSYSLCWSASIGCWTNRSTLISVRNELFPCLPMRNDR